MKLENNEGEDESESDESDNSRGEDESNETGESENENNESENENNESENENDEGSQMESLIGSVESWTEVLSGGPAQTAQTDENSAEEEGSSQNIVSRKRKVAPTSQDTSISKHIRFTKE